ncbi:MAG: peptidogalycan biosysnthesis protein, partial [Bauldia sp.]
MTSSPEATFRVLSSLKEIAPDAWDACANPEGVAFNPFLSHAFLWSLEESGAASAKTGWAAHHLVLDGHDGGPVAVMPCYRKSHSMGEYVFDHGWADSYEQAGGRYYPKLQVSVPFTPVTGRRLLVGAGADAA